MTRPTLVLLLTAAALVAAAPARAQFAGAAAPRPMTPLFGPGRPTGEQSLDLSLATFGGYDTNVVEDDPGSIIDPRTQRSGSFSGLNARLAYVRKFRRVSFGLTGDSALRYYGGGSDILGMQHAAGASFDVALERTHINVGQTLAFVPFYSFSTLPVLFTGAVGDVLAPNADQSIVRRDERLYATFVTVSRSIGQRLLATASGSLQGADFSRDSTAMRNLSGMARLSYGLTKNLSLVAGYGASEATYREPLRDRQRFRTHSVDAGLMFNRPLSLTRRTTLGVTAGTTAIQDESGITQYRLIADARLNREIGRTWHATAAYHRGVGFVEGFLQPFYTDSLNLSVGGLFGSRVEATVTGGYTNGEMGLGTTTRTESYSGTTRLRVALSREVALSAQYLLYRYRFDQADLLPGLLPPYLERQGLRIGLDVWLPLVR